MISQYRPELAILGVSMVIWPPLVMVRGQLWVLRPRLLYFYLMNITANHGLIVGIKLCCRHICYEMNHLCWFFCWLPQVTGLHNIIFLYFAVTLFACLRHIHSMVNQHAFHAAFRYFLQCCWFNLQDNMFSTARQHEFSSRTANDGLPDSRQGLNFKAFVLPRRNSSSVHHLTMAYNSTSSPQTTVIQLCIICGWTFSSIKNSITARYWILLKSDMPN